MGNTCRFGTPSSSATHNWKERRIPCSNLLAPAQKPVRTVDAPSTNTGRARFMRAEIPPRSGVAFELRAGQRLRVIDPRGEDVSVVVAVIGGVCLVLVSSG